MTPRSALTRSIVAAALLALPFAEGGCGRTACFTWSTQEGACPSQSEAMTFFSDPKCPGKVTAVNSAPTTDLDGTLCCYQVTQRPATDAFNCVGAGGFQSSSGEEFVSSGVGGFVSSGQGGFGGSGGDAPCLRCAEAIGSVGTITLCDSSINAFNAVFDCVCNTTCLAECQGTFCSGIQPDTSCNDCLGDISSQGCGKELNVCANDI